MSLKSHLSLAAVSAAALAISAGPALSQTTDGDNSTRRLDILKATDCAAICNAQFECERWTYEPATWKNPQSVCTLIERAPRPTFSFGPGSKNKLTVRGLRNNPSKLAAPSPKPATPVLPGPGLFPEPELAETPSFEEPKDKKRGGFRGFMKRLNPFDGSDKADATTELVETNSPQPETTIEVEKDVVVFEAPDPTKVVVTETSEPTEVVRIEPPVIPVTTPGEAQVVIEDAAPANGPTQLVTVEDATGEISIAKEDKVAPWPPVEPVANAPAAQQPVPEPQAQVTAEAPPELKKRQLRTLRSQPYPGLRENDGAPRYSVQRDAERDIEKKEKP